MRAIVRYALLLVSVCVAISGQTNGQTKTITGKVVAIADGDTITVLDASNKQHKIRFQGIDTPESNQAFGQRAKQNLSDLIFGKQIRVEFDHTDKYGRTLGKVIINGKDVNLEQLRTGMAWFYREYEEELSAADRAAYDAAETEAKNARRGLWTDPSPQPPWHYRHPARNASSKALPQAAANDAPIIGNRRSMIYHLLACPNYNDVSAQNRVPFRSEGDAQKSGFRKAKNCP